MFISQDVNEQRVFGVFFYINGTKRLVMVEDHIPINTDGEAAFATNIDSLDKDRKKLLWVSILEKAWAKVHKSYDRI